MKYKMIVTDYDGTLLGKNGVNPRVIDAIARYREAGGIVAINTGRTAPSIIRDTQAKGLFDVIGEYIGSYNGGLVTDKRCRWIDKHTLSTAKSLKMIEILENTPDVFLQIYANDFFYCTDRVRTPATDTYVRACRCLPIIVPSLSRVVEDNDWELFKIVAFTYPAPSYPLCDKMNEMYGEEYKISTSGPAFIEVNDISAGKGVGVEMLARAYGVEVSETVAIGDGGNDIPMLKRAGLGVSVANAREEVKSEADMIVCSADDGAVAELIDLIMEDKI